MVALGQKVVFMSKCNKRYADRIGTGGALPGKPLQDFKRESLYFLDPNRRDKPDLALTVEQITFMHFVEILRTRRIFSLRWNIEFNLPTYTSRVSKASSRSS